MREVAAAVVLVAAVAVFRLIGPLAGGSISLVLANISPLAAVVVVGAIYLPRRVAFAVPFGALFVSTVAVNLVKGWPVGSPYTLSVALCFALVFAMAWPLRGTSRASAVLGMTMLGTLVFYTLSNTVAWVFEPGYARTPGGWIQAQTIGLPIPGAPPSWWFLVKSLTGDLLFASLMVALCHPKRRDRMNAVTPPTAETPLLPRPLPDATPASPF